MVTKVSGSKCMKWKWTFHDLYWGAGGGGLDSPNVPTKFLLLCQCFSHWHWPYWAYLLMMCYIVVRCLNMHYAEQIKSGIRTPSLHMKRDAPNWSPGTWLNRDSIQKLGLTKARTGWTNFSLPRHITVLCICDFCMFSVNKFSVVEDNNCFKMSKNHYK